MTSNSVATSLGEVRGFHDQQSDTIRFLGIPYGNVSRRWTRAKMVTSFVGGVHDGTNYGPICPQPHVPGRPSIWEVAVPGFPANPDFPMHEFDCLNLNIVKPNLQSRALLPVMVWIHGGALSVGSTSELIYDGSAGALVKQSVGDQQPIIYVSMNYRLGLFGFLASQQLLEENNGQAVGNYGLWDQRLALEFVQKYIQDFGGDPARVTIFGESAGGASVHSHLLSRTKFMSQAICQSGVTRTCGGMPIDNPYMQGFYEELVHKLGLESNANPQKLREMSAAEILAATMPLFPSPLHVYFILDDTHYEDSFFPHDTDWTSPSHSCKRFMIGDCANEGIVVAQAIAAITPASLEKLLSKTKLSESYVGKFGLLSNSPQKVMAGLIGLDSETGFTGPTQAVIESSPPNSTYVYRFNRPNSWHGQSPFQGTAHHTIDLLYLGGVPARFPTTEPEVDILLSQEMMKHWLAFVNGGEPWSPIGSGETRLEMVYAKNGKVLMSDKPKASERDFEGLKEIIKKPYESLAVHTAFAAGKIL